MAKGEELTADLLPLRIRAASTAENAVAQHFPIHAGMTLSAVEKEFILMTLASTRGNKKETAQQLGISRRTLYDKLKKHGIAHHSTKRFRALALKSAPGVYV